MNSSQNTAVSSTETTGSTGNTSSTVTPVEAIAIVRALRDRIPNWNPLPRAEAQRLHSAASLNQDFIAVTVSAVGTSEKVSTAISTSKDALQQLTIESTEWRQVEDEIRSLLLGVRGANLVRDHGIGLTALQAYSISRQLVRKEDNKDLLAHVDQLRRMGRRGKRKASSTPSPAPSTMQ